jgi:predicted TIM-barrel fold metal-dependent hydrolase
MRWLNSADAHLQESADLWTRRLPKHLRERAPRYEYTSTHRIWIAEGRPFATDPLAEQERENGTLITDDVDLRLKDLDADGIWAETIFGNLGLQCLRFEDPDFALACSRVYNDYISETFSAYKAREIPIAVIPIGDLRSAVSEIERVAKLGLRGACLPMAANPPYSHECYEPIWSAVQSHCLPVSFHFGTGLDVYRRDWLSAFGSSDDALALSAQRATRVRLTSLPNAMTFLPQSLIGAVVGSGILASYPGLNITCVEASAAWLASLMEAMDFAVLPMRGAQYVDMSKLSRQVRWSYPMLPSEYVRRQIKVTFQDEPAPLKFLGVTGNEPLMWGSDFPHPEGTWPHSHEITNRLFARTDESDKRAILSENLAKLYGIEMPSA